MRYTPHAYIAVKISYSILMYNIMRIADLISLSRFARIHHLIIPDSFPTHQTPQPISHRSAPAINPPSQSACENPTS